MKKYYKLLAVFVVCGLLTGCGGSSKGVDVKGAEGDSQPYWNIFNQPVARAPQGYYYMVRSKEDPNEGYLTYMDAQTQDTTVVCNKPDCFHKDTNCNACFYSGDGYEQQSIYYYKDKIYLIRDSQTDGYAYLEEVTPDGSTRKTLFEVGVVRAGYKLMFCQDAVFVSNRIGGNGMEPTTETIRRRSLDGKEDEIIYEYRAQGAQITAVKNYGDKLFFTVTEWPRANKDERRAVRSNGVFVYDLGTKQTTHLLEKNISDFTVNLNDGSIYYYVIDDGLYRRALSGGEEKRIYACDSEQYNNYCQISNDGKYLYVSNEQYRNILFKLIQTYMWVLDLDGNVVNQIETPTAYATFFGDERYAFGYTKSDDLTLIPKEDIATEKEWTPVR